MLSAAEREKRVPRHPTDGEAFRAQLLQLFEDSIHTGKDIMSNRRRMFGAAAGISAVVGPTMLDTVSAHVEPASKSSYTDSLLSKISIPELQIATPNPAGGREFSLRERLGSIELATTGTSGQLYRYSKDGLTILTTLTGGASVFSDLSAPETSCYLIISEGQISSNLNCIIKNSRAGIPPDISINRILNTVTLGLTRHGNADDSNLLVLGGASETIPVPGSLNEITVNTSSQAFCGVLIAAQSTSSAVCAIDLRTFSGSTPTATTRTTSTATEIKTSTQTATKTSTPTPTKTLTPTPTTTTGGTTFAFGSDVSTADRDLIRNNVDMTLRYWGPAAGSIKTYAFSNINNLLDTYSLDCLCIPNSNLRAELQLPNHFLTTAPGSLLILTSSTGEWGTASPNTKNQSITHSSFHSIQSAFSNWHVEPIYMAEGGADYSMSKVRSVNGYEPFADMRIYYKNQARFFSSLLSDFVTWRSGISTLEQAEPYTLGFLLSDMLAQQYGEPKILEFWRKYGDAVRVGQSWQAAIQNTWGISENQLYNMFESQRAAQFPPLTCGTLRNPNFSGSLMIESCGSIDLYPAGSNWRPYIFCVAGFDLRTLTPQQRTNALVLPTGGLFYDYVPTTHTNCEGVFLQDNTTSGSLNVTLSLPDGRSATTGFTPR